MSAIMLRFPGYALSVLIFHLLSERIWFIHAALGRWQLLLTEENRYSVVCDGLFISSFTLDVGWVQHDSDGSTESLGWQVLSEVGSHNTVVAVGSGDLTPDDSDLGTSLLLGASVDVGNSLTQVELSVLCRLNTVDLNQRHVRVGHALGALVGQVLTLNVH